MFDKDIFLTCFRYFPDCLQLDLFGIKNIKVRSIYTQSTYIGIGSAEDYCIRDFFVRDGSTKDTSIGVA